MLPKRLARSPLGQSLGCGLTGSNQPAEKADERGHEDDLEHNPGAKQPNTKPTKIRTTKNFVKTRQTNSSTTYDVDWNVHLMELEICGEIFNSRRPAEGEDQAVFASTKDGSDLVLFVVEVRLTQTTTHPYQHQHQHTVARAMRNRG